MKESTWKAAGALLVAIAGGIVGALLVVGRSIGHTVDWGTVLAAAIAAVGTYFVTDLLGLRDHARRQARDEMSRRFVDEGFDRLGRALDDGSTALAENASRSLIAITAAQWGHWEIAAQRLRSMQSLPHSSMEFECTRINALLESEVISAATRAAVDEFRQARLFFGELLPSQLAEIESRKAERGSSEQLEKMSSELEEFKLGDRSLRIPLARGMAALSVAFQAAAPASVDEAMKLRTTDAAFGVAVRALEAELQAAVDARAKYKAARENEAAAKAAPRPPQTEPATN